MFAHPRIAVAAAVVGMGIQLCACSERRTDGGDAPIERPASAQARRVSYTLWNDLSGIDETLGGHTITTNLGYEVVVVRAVLVQASASLVHCHLASDGSPLTWGSAWRLVFGASVAQAGHPVEIDPSTVAEPRYVDLLSAEPVQLGQQTFETTRYCKLHIVSAPGTHDEAALDGYALLLDAHYRRGDEEPVSLDVRSPLSYGAMFDFADTVHGIEGTDAEVELTRVPARMFEGVDFAALARAESETTLMSPAGKPQTVGDEVGRQVIRNLVLQTQAKLYFY